MEDTSLMNPDHLNSEIKDLETVLIPNLASKRLELNEAYDRIIEYVKDTHNRGEDTTLTHEQVAYLIRTLSEYKFEFNHTIGWEFTLKVYNALKRDRRWIVGSKLRFLKKK